MGNTTSTPPTNTFCKNSRTNLIRCSFLDRVLGPLRASPCRAQPRSGVAQPSVQEVMGTERRTMSDALAHLVSNCDVLTRQQPTSHGAAGSAGWPWGERSPLLCGAFLIDCRPRAQGDQRLALTATRSLGLHGGEHTRRTQT